MQRRTWIILYSACLLADLLFIGFDLEPYRLISKPLLLLLLMAFFISSCGSKGFLAKAVLGALFFSWLGDVLLLFTNRAPVFFIAGLSAFLVAHLFYILVFNRIRRENNFSFRKWILLPVAIYYAVLITLLFDGLGMMKLPVIIYGLVISTMLVMAFQLKPLQRNIYRLLIGGALLFISSDSLLAISLFYTPFTADGLLVMLTYGLAQVLLVAALIRQLSHVQVIS